MTKKYLLAIDQGTSSTRATIVDSKGQMINQAQTDITQYFPNNGWVEHDMEEIWRKTHRVCQQVLAKSKLTAKQITACGITNQRETTVLWDKATAKPLHRAIVWQDHRTNDYCKQLNRQGLTDMIREKTGLRIDPYFSATKIAITND